MERLQASIRAYAAAWVARDREAWLGTFSIPREIFVVGQEAAMVWTIQGTTQDGAVSFDGVDVFRFDDSGLIDSVRAFWDRDALQHQFQRVRGAQRP